MRLIPFGTPSRTKQYLQPGTRLRGFLLSLALGAGLLALLGGIYWKGTKSVATPGALASKHAPYDARCASCHAPSLTEARCEYCHDPFGSGRFENAGHVWFGTKDPVKIARAATVPCEQCHSDHRGRDFLMRRVDERECAPCHFRSMAKHTPFNLEKVASATEEGLKFPHKRHLAEMKKAKLDECQFCHEPTRDRRGFEPIAFDRQCARCHLPNGNIGATDPIPRLAVVVPVDIGAPWADQLAGNVRKFRDKIVLEKLQHPDPWILYNLWKIAREVDPDGLASNRAALAAEIEQLQYQLREAPLKGLTIDDLQKREATLVASLEQFPAGSPAGKRRKLEKDLERVRVQIELKPLGMTPPRPRGRRELQDALRDRQAELSDFDIALGEVSPVPLSDRQIRLTAVTAMTAPCARCHIYNGPLMVPVNAAKPVLAHARFNHLQHVEQGCMQCHGMIVESTKAGQINLPPVTNCQKCHKAGRSRDDCAECHNYHPLSDPWPPI